jgi:hypothetical protein
VITDFAGPNVDIKYEDMVEGKYNFTLAMKNEHFKNGRKLENVKEKNFIVSIKHTKLLNIENRPFKEFPVDLPEKEVKFTRYVKYDGPLVFLGLRDQKTENSWCKVKHRFRILAEDKKQITKF